MLLSNHIGPTFGGACCCTLIVFFKHQPHSWILGSAVATSISIPRSASAAEGRDPRSTAAEDSDRPKAAIDGGRRPASGCVEPAEHEPVQRRQFRLKKKAPSTRPCEFRGLYAPATPCCFRAAPYAMPWRLCDLSKYPAALTTTIVTATDSFPPLRSRISEHRSSSHFPGASQRRPLPGNAHPTPLSENSISHELELGKLEDKCW